jgi:N-methylhydantoinase B/oxoprolinase/acetone carboxylase alpha subunit
MSHPSVDYIIQNSPESIEADNLFRKTQTSQALVSKRFGKARYIETLNNAFKASLVPFEPISDGIKYLSDKVGINTVTRYNKDIISYAEVYMGEYSVTYDQEVVWN